LTWHLVTGEYPPQRGGVSDYTRLVACGLAAAGDRVDVWAPACGLSEESDAAVTVHRLRGRFGPRAMRELARAFDSANGARVLLQYVPHAFGMKAMNLPFCLWLYARRRHGAMVMFHEVMFPSERGQPLGHRLIGEVTCLMARIVARSATRIFVAAPVWQRVLRERAGVDAPTTWLPVPSTIPVVDDAAGVAAARRRYSSASGVIVGHFGACGELIARPLAAVIAPMLEENPSLTMLLIGANSEAFRERFSHMQPSLAPRVRATGRLAPADLSRAISACDLMLQPYPDGVTTRRTSLMTIIAHGRPVVTTSGWPTEAIWTESGAVALAPAGDVAELCHRVAQLNADEAQRARYGRAGRALYECRFAVTHTINALRAA